MKAVALIALAWLAACAPAGPTADLSVQTRAIASATLYGAPRPVPTQRSNAQIARDILALGFALESGREIPRFSRFQGPVTLRLTGARPPLAVAETERLLARLRAEAGIDITRTDGDDAQITVEFVPAARMRGTVPQASCFVVPDVAGWDGFRAALRDGGLDWTTVTTRARALVVVPADSTVQEMRDCLHEEVAQALGPLNDLYRIPGTVWNDDNFQTVLTGYDMLVLRVWHDPALQPGMTRAQVAQRLPAILARRNPRGGPAAAPVRASPTPPEWRDAVEGALSTAGRARRFARAQRALRIAAEAGWQDSRLAFSLFLTARFAPPARGADALDALLQASRLYAGLPDAAVPRAYVELHLAAQALGAGQFAAVRTLTARGIDVARRAENGALLSSLMLLRAQALAQAGDTAQAAALRDAAAPHALFGFGSDKAAAARRDEIALLTQP